MTAGHFIYIPVILLVGIVIGWILGGRPGRPRGEGCVFGGAEEEGEEGLAPSRLVGLGAPRLVGLAPSALVGLAASRLVWLALRTS
jgi:hypothetical protein